MTTEKESNFTRPTLKFCIAGLFIPGFTAIAIFGLQIGLGLLGIECPDAWVILWVLTAIGAIAAPVIFIRLVNKWFAGEYSLTTGKLMIFNIVEYILIQCALTACFTSGKTLCYVTDGQNGIEFVFTAWMALPVLIVLSLIFDFLRQKEI